MSRRAREIIGRGTLLIVCLVLMWAGWKVLSVALDITAEETFTTGRRHVAPGPVWVVAIALLGLGLVGAVASVMPLRWLERFPVRTRSLGDHPQPSGPIQTFWWP